MSYHENQKTILKADRYKPGNPPDRSNLEEYQPLKCPCGVVTKHGEYCPECLKRFEDENDREKASKQSHLMRFIIQLNKSEEFKMLISSYVVEGIVAKYRHEDGFNYRVEIYKES